MYTQYEKMDCKTAYNKIKDKLEQSVLDAEYEETLSNLKQAGREFIVYCASMDISILTPDTIKQVIGSGGCYFKKTTSECDLDLLWHNRTKNTFEFWGPMPSIKNAIFIINKRIKNKAKRRKLFSSV